MKGILFKPDMIRAIVEGRKTVTRQPLNPQPEWLSEAWYWKHSRFDNGDGVPYFHSRQISPSILEAMKPCARYHIGETVYLKEAWAKVYDDWPPYEEEEKTPYHIEYKSDTGDTYPGHWPRDCKDDEACGRWKSPQFLPEKFARYFIQIVDVRPERLQEITAEDCLKEGVSTKGQSPYEFLSTDYRSPAELIKNYQARWDSINNKIKPEERIYSLDDNSNRHFVKGQQSSNSWNSNPWVWRIEFKRVEFPRLAEEVRTK